VVECVDEVKRDMMLPADGAGVIAPGIGYGVGVVDEPEGVNDTVDDGGWNGELPFPVSLVTTDKGINGVCRKT